MWTRIGRCFSLVRLNAGSYWSLQQLGKTPRHHRWNQTLASPFSEAPRPRKNDSLGIRHACALEPDRQLKVQWEDGSNSLYPLVWLRDNCQCPQCMLQSAKARSLHLSQLDIHTGVDRVLVKEPNKLSVVWPDQHASEYDADWLKKRCFSPVARQAMREELFLNERVYWGSELRIPSAIFQEVLEDDKAALDCFTALRRVGIVYLKGAPREQGEVAKLSKRIGFLRLTFYGHTFQVQDKLDANNVAYTAGDLSLHTDYPALQHPPGVQVLHCLHQAKEGGESEVVDGFHVAQQLWQENPEAFRTLSSLTVDFTDTGVDYCDFSIQSKHRIIEVDGNGLVLRINYNNATRDSVLDLPLQHVQPFYASLRAYVDLMCRPENVLTYRMEPGDMVIFDNWRLLHGRRRYSMDPEHPRHLEGAYLDWDVVMSRLRLLQKAIHEDR